MMADWRRSFVMAGWCRSFVMADWRRSSEPDSRIQQRRQLPAPVLPSTARLSPRIGWAKATTARSEHRSNARPMSRRPIHQPLRVPGWVAPARRWAALTRGVLDAANSPSTTVGCDECRPLPCTHARCHRVPNPLVTLMCGHALRGHGLGVRVRVPLVSCGARAP